MHSVGDLVLGVIREKKFLGVVKEIRNESRYVIEWFDDEIKSLKDYSYNLVDIYKEELHEYLKTQSR